MRRSTHVCVGMLAVLVAGLGACARGGQQVGQSSTTSPASSVLASPPAGSVSESPSTSQELPRLGPSGYGALSLGMTKAGALATGLTTAMTALGEGGCGAPVDGYLVGSPNTDGVALPGRLFFSNRTGRLVAIYAFPGVKTPEGIGLGSTYEQLHAAYPGWAPMDSNPGTIDGRASVLAPGNANAHYRIVVANSKVTEISLDSNQQDCYE